MQADLEQIQRHQRALEDRELEFMEAQELVDGELAVLDRSVAHAEAEITGARRCIAEQEAIIDAEIAAEEAARSASTAMIPPDLLALYEKCRSTNRGRGCGQADRTHVSGLSAHDPRERGRPDSPRARGRAGVALRQLRRDPGAERMSRDSAQSCDRGHRVPPGIRTGDDHDPDLLRRWVAREPGTRRDRRGRPRRVAGAGHASSPP